MSADERAIFISFLKMIRAELEKPWDRYQDAILVTYIDLILKHCMRFYDRQFATRKAENSDVLARFEATLRTYYDTGEQLSGGRAKRSVLCREALYVCQLFQ